MLEHPPAWLAPARGTTLAVLITLITIAGHDAGGGTLPGLSPLVVLFPMLVTVLVGCADRCRSLLSVLVVLGTGQLALHHLMVVLALHGHGVDGGVPASRMLAMHAVATVLTAAAARGADTALLVLLRALRRVLPRRAPAVPADAPLPARPVPEPDVPLRTVADLIAVHARRGPPTAC